MAAWRSVLAGVLRPRDTSAPTTPPPRPGPGGPPREVALRTLHEVIHQVHASLDLSDTLDAVARGVLEATCFGVVVINLAQPSGDHEVVSVEGDEAARAELLGKIEPAAQWELLMARAERWGNLRFVHHDNAWVDGDTMLSWIPDTAVSDDPDAWHPHDALFAPLVAPSGAMLGALSVDLPEGGCRPTADQREILEMFAVHAAIAIEHARVTAQLQRNRDELHHAAHHDGLTTLANRSLLMTEGTRLAAATGRLGVLVLDLDRFKAVNDAAGHRAGDEVLEVLAGRMRASVRAQDLLARSGGDEFVVVAPLTSTAGDEVVVELAARLRAVCSEPVVGVSGSHAVGVSVGCAVVDTPARFEDVLSAADAAMYAEKRASRAASA